MSSNALTQIKESAIGGKLVVVIGTGVSLAFTNGKQPALSWKGLIENGFEYGVTKGKISEQQKLTWRNQLESEDIDELLGAADFMAKKIGAPNGELYGRWLESVFRSLTPENKAMSNAIQALQTAGIPICTLNYDPLLEQVTGLPGITIDETNKVTAWMRREQQSILHLHGVWDKPVSCVLGIRDYEATIGHDFRDLLQRALSSFGRLLFVGCGDTFVDPNFSALTQWLRKNLVSAAPQHFALVRANEVARRHADVDWQGFVEPIGYGKDQKDLPEFLLREFPTTAMTMARRAARAKPPALKDRHAKTLEEYRAFLIKDCGQMTIEGMRADINTAQRRFDLERLFVPARLLPTPPDFESADPQREQKLIKWEEENRDALKFGEVFKKNRRIALLAMPGAGKSLLLKRLAVAYSDPERRQSSDDALPDSELVPVLIRCREWKDYIRRPISTLLREMHKVTGQVSLEHLYDALVPHLKKGRVLLLIDGLDEIHDDGDRLAFAENLENFLSQFEKIRIVVTSREAGFGLIAPPISRCCARWRVAPLDDAAIRALCTHWHILMKGDAPESLAESRDVAERLLQSDSLKRLAENPLLLTMLLVVKHGAGRLPPDRVGLYGRAIEVLLDTWNIKGHESLNLKEAVPQLACVAFELLRKGQQTATGAELLKILEDARDSVPHIRRYARDLPDAFLQRVELRSGLLVEAGHQLEEGRTVPFYQFRHLTFQEHLAAVAAVDGYYLGHKIDDDLLSPLGPYLLSEEWKEVVPMAAVLAKKRAEPLLGELVKRGIGLRADVFKGETSEVSSPDFSLPSVVSRLVQCFSEEAEASSETLTSALQLIALFGKGCLSSNSWHELCSGPYGEELIHQTWLVYERMDWPTGLWVRNTLAMFLLFRRPASYWQSEDARKEIAGKLAASDRQDIVSGLLISAGFLWGSVAGWGASGWKQPKTGRHAETDWIPLASLELHIQSDDAAIWNAAAWAWSLVRRARVDGGATEALPQERTLDLTLSRWLSVDERNGKINAFALSTVVGLPRDYWQPKLDEEHLSKLRESIDASGSQVGLGRNEMLLATFVVAFHSRTVCSEHELAASIERWLSSAGGRRDRNRKAFETMLMQFEEGRGVLAALGEEPVTKRGNVDRSDGAA
jgi:hypothetical protein